MSRTRDDELLTGVWDWKKFHTGNWEAATALRARDFSVSWPGVAALMGRPRRGISDTVYIYTVRGQHLDEEVDSDHPVTTKQCKFQVPMQGRWVTLQFLGTATHFLYLVLCIILSNIKKDTYTMIQFVIQNIF